MMTEYSNKLKYHKILLMIFSVFYSLLGTFLLAHFDRLGEDFMANLGWFLMLLLLLAVIASFDPYAQPFLSVYRKSLTPVPWLYWLGFLGGVAIVHFTNYIVLSIILLYVCAAGALALYCLRFHRVSKMGEEEIRRKVVDGLIKVDANSMEFLKKRRTFFRWSSLISIAVILVIGKLVMQFKWLYAALLLLIAIFNLICYFPIYFIRYPSRKSAVGHWAVDGLIGVALLTLSVLFNFGIISFGGADISALDILMLSCFGLIPFAKQSSFAYFAVEHARLRAESEGTE